MILNDKISSVNGISTFKTCIKNYLEKCEEMKKSSDALSAIKTYKVKKLSLKILENLRITGVDGSQITPLREFGIPLGAVQVAAFMVDRREGCYDVKYKSAIVHFEKSVELERYKMEMEMVSDCLNSSQDFVLYDGSFRPSFSAELRKDLREKYRMAAKKAIEVSFETKVKLVGYIDRSYAKDFAKMVGVNGYDIHVLSDMEDGSYTEPIFVEDRILCSYLKISPLSKLPTLPVRIEFPEWMKSCFKEVVNVIFAECLLGSTSAYPYVLERAHKYAVITEKEKSAIISAISSAVKDVPSSKWISKLFL